MKCYSLCRVFGSLLTLQMCNCSRVADAKPIGVPDGQVWLSSNQVSDAKLQVEKVQPQAVSDRIVTAGRVSLDDSRVSHVYCPVTGKIVKLFASLGQRVKAGDALAAIDSPDLGVASAELSEARAELQATEHQFQRERELYAANAASQREFEDAQGKLTKARAELGRTMLKTRLLRGSASDSIDQWYILRAPIAGDVLARNVSLGMEIQGQYANGSLNELFTIGELDPVWIIADVYSNDLLRVRPQAATEVQLVSFGERIFTGQVDYISSVINADTQTLSVRVVIPNPKRELKPNMFATVSITARGAETLAVPRQAIQHFGDTATVFAQLAISQDGRSVFERRPIVVDEDVPGGLVPVSHGVTAGDRIVVAGAGALAALF